MQITTKSSRKVESKSDNKLKIIENAQNSNNILKRKSTNKEETTPPKISKLNNAQKSIEKNKIESPQFAKSQTKNTAGPSTSQVNSQKNDNKFAMPNVNNSPISRRTRNSKVKKIIAKPPQLDGATSESKSKRTSKKPNLNRLKKNSSNQSDDNDEDNCQPSTSKKSKVESKIPAISKLKRIDRRVLSTDNEDMDSDSNTKKLPSMDFWVEVYCEVDEKWIAINLFKLKFNCIEEIRVIKNKKKLHKTFKFILYFTKTFRKQPLNLFAMYWHGTTITQLKMCRLVIVHNGTQQLEKCALIKFGLKNH